MPSPHARRRILLIDDSQKYSLELELALTRAQPGTAVRWINNGRDAIEHLLACGARHPMPDLVLLDREMPGGPDGFDVLTAVRGCVGLAAVDVIMVSGSDEEEHVERALRLGAAAYICKPVERQELVAFAATLAGWPPRSVRLESLRGSGGEASGSALARVDRSLHSVGMIPSAQVIDVSSPQEDSGFLKVFHAVQEFVKKTVDPVDYAISELCRKHHIPPAHARGRQQDQVTVANRKAVIFDFWDLGFSDPVTMDNFQLSQRAVERLRAEWRARKGGGSLADRPK